MKGGGREQTVAFGSWRLHSCSLGAIHHCGPFSWAIQLLLNQYYLFSSGQACIRCNTLGRKLLRRHIMAMSSWNVAKSVGLAGHWWVQDIWATSSCSCRRCAVGQGQHERRGLQHLLTTLLVSFHCELNTSLFHSFAWSSSPFCQTQLMLKVISQGHIMSSLNSSWWHLLFTL